MNLLKNKILERNQKENHDSKYAKSKSEILQSFSDISYVFDKNQIVIFTTKSKIKKLQQILDKLIKCFRAFNIFNSNLIWNNPNDSSINLQNSKLLNHIEKLEKRLYTDRGHEQKVSNLSDSLENSFYLENKNNDQKGK